MSAAVRLDDGAAAGGETREPGDGAAGALTHQRVEVAADEQEEQQGYRRVEEDVLAAADALEQAEAQRQQHRERDRHIHVEPPSAQAGNSRDEEWMAGIRHHRQGDRGREKVERLAQARIGAGPHSDGQQHHVAGAKAGHRHRAKQPLSRGGRRGDRSAVLDGGRGIAERFQPLDNRHGVGVLPSQRHQDPARGEIDPRRRHLWQLVERPLDRGDALAAADLRRRER